MNHPYNKDDEWAKEKNRKREAYKNGRSQCTRDCENSTGSGGNGKILTLYSQMHSALFTDCGMSQSEIKNCWTL